MEKGLSQGGRFILGLLTGLVSLTAIATWYNAPKGKLRASIVANDYAAPPIRQTLQDTLQKPPSIVARPTPAGIEVSEIGAYLTARIENGGSKEVKQVTLRVPDVAYSCLQRESARWACQDAGSIVIGDLSPLEVANVQVWLRSKASPSTLTDIRLTHSEGLGRVDLQTVELPKGFIADNKALLGMLVFFLLLISHGVYADRWAEKRIAWEKAKEAEKLAKADKAERDAQTLRDQEVAEVAKAREIALERKRREMGNPF
jgi:hypothetical protein